MVCWDTEFWSERNMQKVKRDVKYRTSGCPELTLVNGYLFELAILTMAAKDRRMKKFDDLCPEYRANPITGERVDEPAEDGTQCLGSGQKAKDDGMWQVGDG